MRNILGPITDIAVIRAIDEKVLNLIEILLLASNENKYMYMYMRFYINFDWITV